MTTCSACDGKMYILEPINCFGGEITYRDIECDCDNGKMIDDRLVRKEIDEVKHKIRDAKDSVNVSYDLAKEYYHKNEPKHVFHAFGAMLEYEQEIEQLTEYLSELEEI